jgi:deazaflavin-dependent oxidoreductase (nitroreductase family)
MSEAGGGRLKPSTMAELRRLKPVLRLMSRIQSGVIRASGGRLGTRFLRGAPVGLLTTRGRKSGQPRTLPLIYLEDGERIVIVASQGGMPRHPIWYLNLEAHPEVTFQVGARRRGYRARRADAGEKAVLWPRLCAVYRDYDDYQRRTERDIPVVILEPAGDATLA